MSTRDKWLPPNQIPPIKERPKPSNQRAWIEIVDALNDILDFRFSRLEFAPSSAAMSVPYNTFRKLTKMFSDEGRRINNITVTDAMPILEQNLIFLGDRNDNTDCPDYDKETGNSYRGSVWAFYELCQYACYHRDALKMEEPVIKIRR